MLEEFVAVMDGHAFVRNSDSTDEIKSWKGEG
jgi:hypothetical protein